MSDTKAFFELKEKAKWARDVEEKKTAIKELSSYGEKAIPFLEEIRNVTAYEDIRSACIEAIRSIKGEEKASQQQQQPSNKAATTAANDVKKKEKTEGEAKAEPRLADLPP